MFHAQRQRGNHIVTTCIEHPAVLAPCRFLESLGAEVTYLPVDSTGRVDPRDLERAIGPRTILVSIMHSNNEVGTIQPIDECARIARDRGVPFQSVGKIATDVGVLETHMLPHTGMLPRVSCRDSDGSSTESTEGTRASRSGRPESDAAMRGE